MVGAPIHIPQNPEVAFADGIRTIPEWQGAFLLGDEDRFTYEEWVRERVNARMVADHIRDAIRPTGR